MNDADSWFDKVPGGYYKTRPVPGQAPQDSRDRGYRRRSEEYDDLYDDRHDRRGDKRRDSHRSRSSYDRDDRRNRQRRYDDYDDRPRQDDRYREEQGRFREPQYREEPQYDDEIPPEAMRPEDIAAGGFAAGVAAAKMDQEEKQQYSGYVPYSNIYNPGAEASREVAFSLPPRGSVSSPQPNAMNQVSPPRRTSVAPEPLYQDQYQRRGYDGNADYDDDRYSRPSRPPMSRLRSRSYDSYDSRDGQSWRDPRNGRSGSASRGKSQSRLNTTFDKSKRGFGYSAVGALAGGLVGSEYGGSVSTTIGAVLGGLGANMFEAREKRKHIARDAEYVRDDELTSRRERRVQERRDSRSGGSWVG